MPSRALFFLASVCLVVAATPRASAQSVISARSGLINFSEGDVVLDGHKIARTYGAYIRVKAGSDLVTRSGRAEILLTPDAYLRIGADSAIRMISDSLTATRVELLGGSAILDSSAGADGAPVTIIYKDVMIEALKPGLYRVDADPPQLRVFRGEADVTAGGTISHLGPSQFCPLDGGSVVRRFTDGSDSLLDIWSDERHLLISSKLADAQGIGDPLVDPDPDTLAGLDAYLGYVPLGAVSPSAGLGTYGAYGGGVYSGLYFSPYPASSYYGYLAPVFVPSNRRGLGSVHLSTPLTLPRPGFIMVRPPVGPLPVYRPGTPIVTPVHPGVRPVGHR